jgi:hypothetical protein
LNINEDSQLDSKNYESNQSSYYDPSANRKIINVKRINRTTLNTPPASHSLSSTTSSSSSPSSITEPSTSSHPPTILTPYRFQFGLPINIVILSYDIPVLSFLLNKLPKSIKNIIYKEQIDSPSIYGDYFIINAEVFSLFPSQCDTI